VDEAYDIKGRLLDFMVAIYLPEQEIAEIWSGGRKFNWATLRQEIADGGCRKTPLGPR
jgi:hypothetical protein